MNYECFENYESVVRSYCRKFPELFEKAKGSYIYTKTGDSYLDFFCGAGALNYGHNNEYIKKKVIKYLEDDGIVHSLDMYTSSKADFIEEFEYNILCERGYNYKIMFTGPTGTNANEAALKLARKITGRQNVFALMGCFHGMTLGTLALTTDMAARTGSGVALHDVTHIPAPYMFPKLDTIQYMETILEDDHSGISKPAALIIETVQAEGGIHVIPNDWLIRAQKLCEKYDILLIIDEIQVGNCRTGSFFSFERAGIEPDIVTLSKSIGGMGMPFALTLIKPELDIWSPGEHNGTFRGFQLATVAGKAGLEFMREKHIEQETSRKGMLVEQYLSEHLSKIDKRISYRGIGLIWGIDFEKINKNTAKKISQACFNKKLIIELAGRKDSVLKIMPALTISDEDLFKGLDIIMEAIKEICL